MRRFKKWLIDNFLPAWAKAVLLEENEKLRARADDLQATIDKQSAYIAGLEAGIKALRRITIHNGEGNK